jgi:hypothetical protein
MALADAGDTVEVFFNFLQTKNNNAICLSEI